MSFHTLSFCFVIQRDGSDMCVKEKEVKEEIRNMKKGIIRNNSNTDQGLTHAETKGKRAYNKNDLRKGYQMNNITWQW